MRNKTKDLVSSTVDWMSLAIVLVALCLWAYRFLDARFGSVTLPTELANDPGAPLGRFWELAETGRWIGPKPAPVTLLIYSDYECGHCEVVHHTLAKLRRRYPQHLAIVVKHFVDPGELGMNLIPLAAECAAQEGMFWAYHDAAFLDKTPTSEADRWLRLAEEVGIGDLESFGVCVRTRRWAGRIAEQYAEGQRLGITATPTMLLNGTMIVGAAPFEALNEAIVSRLPVRNNFVR